MAAAITGTASVVTVLFEAERRTAFFHIRPLLFNFFVILQAFLLGCGVSGSDTLSEENSLLELLPGNSAEQPENKLLDAELLRIVREALQHLNEREQYVIRGLFYQHKNTVEIARELHCSSQNVGYIKRTALARLGEMLKRRVV